MCGRFTLTVGPAELQDVFGKFSFPPQAVHCTPAASSPPNQIS